MDWSGLALPILRAAGALFLVFFFPRTKMEVIERRAYAREGKNRRKSVIFFLFCSC